MAACQGPGSPDSRAPGQSAAALKRVADSTRSSGDLATAVTLYRRLHELHPDDPQPLGLLGETLSEMKAYTEAVQAYRAAIELAPDNSDFHRGLAVVLLSLDQPDAALVEIQAALNKHPDDPRLYNASGVAHDLVNRHDLAQQDYRKGLALAPKHAGLRNNYGLSLALSGDYPAAVATLNPIAADPGAPSRYRLNLALVYGLAGDDKKAAAITRSSLDEAAIRNNLAYYALLRAMDDKQRAAAIVGAQLHGTPVPDAEQTADAPAEPPKPAPVAQVQTAPLPAPVTAMAATPPEPAPVVKPAPRPAASRVAKAAPPPAPAAQPAKEEPAASTPRDTAAEQSETPTTPAEPTKLARPAEPVAEAKPPQDQESPKAAPPAAAEAAPAPPAAEAAPATVSAKAEKAVRSAASSGFAVQLGSFSSEANARKLAELLNGKGYTVTVSHDRDHDGREWFTVRAGSYGTSDEAAAVAQRLREGENIPAVVVRHRGAAQAQAASGRQG